METSRIDVGDGVVLEANLVEPKPSPVGLVVFVHGSGSSRHSPRNNRVAQQLRNRGLATLLLDLLTLEEDRIDQITREHRFDIDMLSERVVGVLTWLEERVDTAPIGLFGSSTGAAAALIAAERRPDDVSAVVSRGGRPDLAGDSLDRVRAPTLLIVGELDDTVVGINQEARARLGDIASVEIVPGATHLFEEPGALDTVSKLAVAWFVDNLTGS